MADISKLGEEAKIFLAGCIKTMIMVDGDISQSELRNIDNLYTQENFQDYEICLEKFEEIVENSDDFWKMAGEIKDPDTRDIILNHVYELSLENGIPSEGEKKLYKELEEFWNE